MALPTIAPYALPSEAELPENRAAWRPDPARAVLLIHDMQRYFLRPFAEAPRVALLEQIGRLRRACAELGVPVVYSAQPGDQTAQQRGLLREFWGPGMSADPDQQQIADELAPGPDDVVLTKWRYSAFQRTGLLQLLHRRGRDQLIICGVYAHIGCLMTACEAFMHDIQPFFVADAVADFSPEEHRMALGYAARRCAVTLTADRLLEHLGQGGAARAVGAGALWSRQAVREQVAGLLELPAAELPDDADLLDYGLDSIRLMSLAERWRRQGAALTFADLAERPTLAAWCDLLRI